MSILRIAGLVIGIIGLYLTFRVYRGPKWKRANFILFGIFSLSLLVVSLFPEVLNTISGMLALEQAQRGRLLTLLIFSTVFLWGLLLYFKTRLDNQRYQFDLLVRSLGKEEAKKKIHLEEIKKRGGEIVVLIPAYNEAENLRVLLKKMPESIEGRKLEVLVIDDGSEDGTAEAVEEQGYLVVGNKINRGGGAALRLGYDILKETSAKISVTMDADGQHDPAEIEKLVRPILEDKYDVVIGSRFLGKYEKDSAFRISGIYLSNFIINLLLGSKITDCASGFRAFKVDLLKSVTLREDQYHTSELLIDAIKRNLRVGEAPITISKREFGQTKKGRNLIYSLNFAKAVLKAWWR